MKLTQKGRLKSNGSVIVGFNGSKTYPTGEVTLTFKACPFKTNVAFLVLNTKSTYNVILGRDWIHVMHIVPSTYHQKLKCMTSQGEYVIEVNQHVSKKLVVLSLA